MQNEKESLSSNRENWGNVFQEVISLVNEESGYSGQIGLLFKFFLSPKNFLIDLLVGSLNSVLLRNSPTARGQPSTNISYATMNLVVSVLYLLVPFAGIAAVVVSAHIEYKVFTNLYNYELPKLSANIQDAAVSSDNGGSNNEQQDTSEKQSTRLPLMTVFALETGKCFLIFYTNAGTGYKNFNLLSKVFARLLQVLLFAISLSFTVMYFTELMNQPHFEDVLAMEREEISADFKTKRELIENETKENIDNWQKQVDHLTELKTKEMRGELGSGTGYRTNTEKIQRDIEKYEQDIKDARTSKTAKLQHLNKQEKIKKNSAQGKVEISSEVDPEWMRKTLDLIYKIRNSNSIGDYPRKMAYWCIIIVSVTVAWALELMILFTFTAFGRESST